jgi:two-component system NtrC family sensor kinase
LGLTTKKIYIPLFWKLIIAISANILIFGSVITVIISQHTRHSLQKESYKLGHYIAHNLANQAVPLIENQDQKSLQNLINNIIQIGSTVAYVLIQGPENKTLAHSFPDKIPEGIINSLYMKNHRTESVVRLSTKDINKNIIRDIAEPIPDSNSGMIHVGISEDRIQGEVQKAVQKIIILMVLFLVIGNLGAGILAYLITNPIKTISNVIEELDFSTSKLRLHPRIRAKKQHTGRFRGAIRITDELDYLTEKLNTMIDRLENTYKELDRAQTNLIHSEKLASVGTLTAEIAHEINNPIAGLKNCIRRIRNNPGNTPQNQTYLEMMQEAALKMESMVAGLLDYSRQEKVIFGKVNIREVIEKTLQLISYKIEIYQIEIINDIKDTVPPINGSFNHLEQVFVNFLVNAIHAINEICKIDTVCKRQIHIAAEVENSNLIIRMEDTGTGISSAAREKIFDPFYTTREMGMGTGLGLYVCYNIIKAHKGEIRVESQIGEGTTFLVTLPLNNKAA